MCCNENCIESISIYPNSVTLRKGEWYYDIIAEIIPSSASCNVRWSSSDTSVASVNASTGYIYAQNVGSAVIYASATDGSGVSACIPVTVISGNVVVESVELDKNSMTVEVGATAKLTAIVCPSNATNNTVIWSSSNSAIARVDSDGTIYGLKRGTAIVTATANDGSGKSGSCHVDVTGDVLVRRIMLSPDCVTMGLNKTIELKETIRPEDATNKNIWWESTNPSVVTVTSSGIVRAVGLGYASVIATAQDCGGAEDSCFFEVKPRVESVSITPSAAIVSPGEMIVLAATIEPQNAANKELTWSSSDTDIAIVELHNGKVTVTGVSAGETTINAKSVDKGIIATCRIKVDSREKIYIRNCKNPDVNEKWFEMHFSDGNIWKYVGLDFNYTTTWNKQYEIDNNNFNCAIDFTVQQLAVIYLFDPEGVASYFAGYRGKRNGVSMGALLKLKDRVYEALYGVKPQFFREYANGVVTYYATKDYSESERANMYSTAEILFGQHPIRDIESLLSFAYYVLKDLFERIPGIDTICTGIEHAKALLYLDSITDVFIDGAVNKFFEDQYEMTGKSIYKWAGRLVSALDITINAFNNSFAAPDISDMNIYREIDKKGFSTRFILSDGKEISLNDVIKKSETY